MDIGSLLNQAGGVGAIARELGVDPSTVEQGAGALLPHVVNGVDQQGLPPAVANADAETEAARAGEGGSGLGGLLGGLMGGGAGGGALGGGGGGLGGGLGGGVLGSLIGGGVGNQILGHIFGSKDTSRDVAAQASQQSGVDTDVLKKLLPIVAGAVAMHYITHRNGGGVSGGGSAPVGGVLGSIL